MSVRIESRSLEQCLQRMADAPTGEQIIEKMVARGLNVAKPLAGMTSPTLGANVMADPIVVQGDVATGGFGTNLEYAPYVELGTGRPGQAGQVKNGQPRNPVAGGFTFTLQTFQQGKLRPGWVYHSDTHGFVHTLGQPAAPYMYPAQKLLEDEVVETASVVVRSNIGR